MLNLRLPMNSLLSWISSIFPEISQSRHEADHFRRIANALARETSLKQMAEVVIEEGLLALSADACCLYLDGDDKGMELKATRGCSDEFIQKWQRVPSDLIEFQSEELVHGACDHLAKGSRDLKDVFDCSCFRTLAFAPLMVNRSVTGFIAFLFHDERELSERARSHAMTVIQFCAQALERVRLTEQEQAARIKAESANRAKSEFLANISHEIRTPIGVVQGFTDLLIDSNGLNSSQKHWVSVIRRNTQQLTALIGEVLDISKIEAEKIEVRRTQFCLHELLEDVRTTAHFKAQNKKIDLVFVTKDLPATVLSDPIRMRQIMVNLVGNAVKFTEKGWVKVVATFDRERSRLEITVSDSGVGIPADLHSTIFEPFIQAESGRDRGLGGTGLGLTISKRLALALGGDLVLQSSQPGRGSTFYLSLPCDAVDAVIPQPVVVDAAGTQELAGFRILVVEDSPDNQDLISHLLSLEGAQVDVADSGVSGVKMAMSRHYDVVLMDIQMPGLDGNEAVAWLRSQGYDRPVAALSAHAMSSDKQKSLGEGFDAYLTKPIDRATLTGCLRSLLRVEMH